MALNTTSDSCVAQIVIIGGGIAGLWLLNRLCDSGYDAVLVEKHRLGGGQTLASQGIIHGGLKYALNGVLSPASSAIADMPRRWRLCLDGQGELDLSGVSLLSPDYYMWSSSGYRSRLKTFLGSKALRGRIEALSAGEYPAFFQRAEGSRALRGTLYRLNDFVVDTSSLIEVLAQRHRQRIFSAQSIQLQRGSHSEPSRLLLETAKATVEVRAERFILCAGEGNQQLLNQVQEARPEMQRRPLQMVCLRTAHPQPVYVHCIGDSFGMAPRLTITSHPVASPDASSPEWIWYVGGELAEKGVERSAAEQQQAAREELSETFPWVDFAAARWGSFSVNRAEPRVPSLQRPDTAWLSASGDLLVSWPTKLTLCPDLGDVALEMLRDQQILPGARAEGSRAASEVLPAHFAFPGIAAPRWEDMFND